jgi:uncharacterized protein
VKRKNFLIIFFIIIGVLILLRADIANRPQEIAEKDREFFNLQVGENDLHVEVVTTLESFRLGLGGRDEIGSDGMLFVFSSRRVASFWMKDMKFGLDMIWIDGDEVVEITKNIPPPNRALPEKELELYLPKSPVDKVLEVPARDSDRLKIEVGDKVKL